MPDEKPTPDDLTKTTDDDITLTEADLNQVSGGVQKVREAAVIADKSSPLST